jgi:glycosyltransferase involved in cell wall biosynthesis
MKKKILFIVDIRKWAFDNIAQSLKKRLSSDYDVDIKYWEDFSQPEKIVDAVNSENPSLVHFFFREHLHVLLHLLDRRSKTAKAFCARAITTHIPDYLHHELVDLFNKKQLFEFVDSYFTTNADLLAIYSNCTFMPKPYGVIHDWVDVEPIAENVGKDSEAVKILWSGNSKWGEYAGHNDYKGLNRIIKPAIKAVQQNYPHVAFICHDSSTRRVDHHMIMNSMRDADIVLIASRKEGTPLTLIEAMASRCAIVSTRVGIAPEILPSRQQEFFCDHSALDLQQKLEKLVADKSLIAELAEENYHAWRRHFSDRGPLKEAWLRFIDQAIARHQTDGAERKLSLIQDRCALGRKLTVNTLRMGARFASQLGIVKTLDRATPKLGATYRRMVYGATEPRLDDYTLIDPIYKEAVSSLNKDHPLVVYAPMWKGVCASSEAIFTDNRIRFPFTDNEYPEVEAHSYIEELAAKLAAAGAPAIVYSGGSLVHQSLARQVRLRNPDLPQFFMWHGSPAQWVDQCQMEFFNRWRTEYEHGTVNGVIVLKRGLEKILQRMGIWSSYIFNPVPMLDESLKRRTIDPDHVKVGLFSSIGSWYKNPFPQLMSLTGMKNIELTTSLPKYQTDMARLGIGQINHIEHMSHGNFLRVLAQQDINLYVTNTECSPMTPLESWESLVPCIVGPAGDVYSSVSKKLAEFLVEKNVDDAFAISKRLQLVIDNYAIITDLLQSSRNKQRALFIEERSKLFQNLKSAPRFRGVARLSA